jgi:hypothetical protein
LLGNRQAFQVNLPVQVDGIDHKGLRNSTTMSKNTTATSENVVLPSLIGPDGKVVNLESPHENLQLTEQELAEIFSRPQMDPNHGVLGNRPESNKILNDELILIESKREKCVDLIRQSTEIHDILEATKTDSDILSINDGKGLDLG